MFKEAYQLKHTNELEEKRAVKNYVTALDFILIEDSIGTVPRKLLTTKGIIELVGDFEFERNRRSKVSNKYAFNTSDIFNSSWNLGKKSYELYKQSIVLFLLTHEKILLDYINIKYQYNLTIEDIKYSYIVNKVNRDKSNFKIKNKKNSTRLKDLVYVKKNNDLFLCKNGEVILLEKEVTNERRRDIGKFKFGRDGIFNKNERSYELTISA